MKDKETGKVNMLPDSSFFASFDEHLKTDNNNRILFSGKFGIGKTFFLDDFFKKNVENYEVFHLYPVNYQISSNKDVFDLLKYDILIALLNKNKGAREDLFKKKDASFFSFVRENISANAFLNKSISYLEISELGKALGRPLKDLLELDKRFQEYKKGEKGFVENFVLEIEKEKILETDYLSHILTQKINEFKKKKESVLILDDLDRMDPEHIFRLLNIFSAFFEQNKNNKFGFDKVVLVTDYDNLKNIFSHKYGEKTCSRGYFNKFYSIEVFDFDNSKIIKGYLNNFFKEIKTENEAVKKSFAGGSYYIKVFLEDILTRSLEIKKLDLRQLMTINKFDLPPFKKYNLDKQTHGNDMWDIIKICIEILNKVYGDKELFKETIREIENNLSGTKQDLRNRNPESTYMALSTQILRNLEKNEIHEYISKHRNTNIKFKGFEIKDSVTRGGIENEPISLVKSFDAQEVKLFYSLLYEYLDKS